MKALVLVIWLVIFTVVLSVCLDMISAANTIENCAGLIILTVSTLISVKTKCFIKTITLWKKLSKSESEQ